MATDSSFYKQVRNREPDWRGKIERRFRWLKLRFDWGRMCYVVHPVEGAPDRSWWEWESLK